MMKTRWLFLLLVIAIGMSFAACDNDSDDSDDDQAGDADDDDDDDDDTSSMFEGLEVSWAGCSLYEGTNDGRAECSMTEMPFDWLDPDDQTFTVAAKRLLANEAATAQIWLLHGGPGASGVIGYPSLMDYLHNNVPGLDVYTLDLRGTGYSEYLHCPDQEDPYSPGGTSLTLQEAKNCGAYLGETWGDDLKVFSNTHGSYDLAAYIHHTQQEGVRSFVYGASGGAYWALRYLQVFPDQVDGVVIEGIAPPGSSIVFQDEYADKAVRKIFELCEQDTVCSSNLPDPEQTLMDLYDKLDQGHCSELGISTYYLKVFLDQLAYYYPWYTVIPPVIYRLDRCNEEDKAAIEKFWNQVWGIGFTKEGADDIASLSFSEPLFFHMLSSELWEYKDYPDFDSLEAYLDEVYVNSLIGYEKGYHRNEIYHEWPRYNDSLDDQWPETQIPLLMLNGELDPSTPNDFAKLVQNHFTSPNQHFFDFDYVAHGVTGSSPYENDEQDVVDCGTEMYFAFLEDPTATLDSSCVEKNLPPDFTGEHYAGYFFGTTDFWGNEKSVHVLGANQTSFSEDDALMKIKEAQIRQNLFRELAAY